MGEWIKCFRLDDKLSGTEMIWQEALGVYQDQRETEANMMAELVDVGHSSESRTILPFTALLPSCSHGTFCSLLKLALLAGLY